MQKAGQKEQPERRTGGATKRGRAREPKAGYARAPPELEPGGRSRSDPPRARRKERARAAASFSSSNNRFAKAGKEQTAKQPPAITCSRGAGKTEAANESRGANQPRGGTQKPESHQSSAEPLRMGAPRLQPGTRTTAEGRDTQTTDRTPLVSFASSRARFCSFKRYGPPF